MKKESNVVHGRALVDIPSHGLKSGEYGCIPADAAQTYIDAGAFDAQAKKP